MKKALVGYQLYSAREEMAQDMKGVFARLKAMGYDGVEFAGFFGKTADEVKALLDESGLVAVSSHVTMDQLTADPFGVISYHQKIGCKYIAIPYLNEDFRPGHPGFAHLIRQAYKLGDLCRAAGMTLLYHNHDFEFEKISGMYGLDFLYDAVDESWLQTEIDVCWVKYSGVDPAAYLRKYAGRTPVVHLKDFEGRKGEGTPYGLIGRNDEKQAGQFRFRPFGYGCQDAPGVVEAGLEGGACWFIVEQDEWYDQNPLDDAEKSIGTLKKIGLK